MNTPKSDFSTANLFLPSKKDLSDASIIEVRDKEARLRRFYENQEFSKHWITPNHTLDYLRMYQNEGSKRKDKYTEDCLHQVEPCLWLAHFYKAGILPERVTRQVLKGKDIEIPPSMQSIEHLFDTIHFHDVDEDFWNSSRKTLEDFLRERVPQYQNLPHYRYNNTIHCLGSSSDAITFGRKIDPLGTTEKTHEGDPQKYLDAMENTWMAIAAKGPDRLGGLITRFGTLEKIFSYEKQNEYLIKTNRLFFHRQILEEMERRYPELGEYFHIVNCNLSIALRCFSTILDNHPDNPNCNTHPERARIILDKNLLDGAFVGAEYVPLDIAPMNRMLAGYKALASRVPIFEPVVTQIEEQLSPYLKRHSFPIPILDNNKACPNIRYP